MAGMVLLLHDLPCFFGTMSSSSRCNINIHDNEIVKLKLHLISRVDRLWHHRRFTMTFSKTLTLTLTNGHKLHPTWVRVRLTLTLTTTNCAASRPLPVTVPHCRQYLELPKPGPAHPEAGDVDLM